MAVRTTVLAMYHGVVTLNGWTVLYQCPEGRTAIVRTQVLSNQIGPAATMFLGVRRGSVTCFTAAAPGAVSGALLHGPPTGVVLNPGDMLCIYFAPASGANAVASYYASGSLLEGVAS